MLVHSNKGKHRAGVLVGCMRRVLMGWSLAATNAEYGRYSGEKGEADLEVCSLPEPAAVGTDERGLGSKSLLSCSIPVWSMIGNLHRIG